MLNFAPLREEQNSFAGETISDKVAAIFDFDFFISKINYIHLIEIYIFF
jgi:hypothetical protein